MEPKYLSRITAGGLRVNNYSQSKRFLNPHLGQTRFHWFQGITVSSSNVMAYLNSSGSVNVVSAQPHRVPSPASSVALADEVSNAVFCPFNDSPLLCIGSNSGEVGLFDVKPAEEEENKYNSIAVGKIAVPKRAQAIQWHPLCSSLLACSSFTGSISIVDTDSCKTAVELDGDSMVNQLEWSNFGRMLATSNNSQSMTVWDVRQGRQVHSVETMHKGPAPFGIHWLRDVDQLATVGVCSSSKQELKLWDLRKTTDAVQRIDFDAQGTSSTYFDNDLGLLYIVPKGRTSLRMFRYETEAGKFSMRESTYAVANSIHAYCFLPKQWCDVDNTEIAAIMTGSESHMGVVTISAVKRKTEVEHVFYEDLYPDTISYEKSYLTSQDWLSGKDATPATTSLMPDGFTPFADIKKMEEEKHAAAEKEKHEAVQNRIKRTEVDEAVINDVYQVIKASTDSNWKPDAVVDEDEWDD